MDRDKREPDKSKARTRMNGILKLLPCKPEDIYCRKIVILTLMSLVLALLITPTFTYDVPTYELGDISDRNIKAKRDFLLEDEEATAKKREEAVRRSPLVYDLDENLVPQTLDRIEASFQSMRDYVAVHKAEANPSLLPQRGLSSPVVESFSPLALFDANELLIRKRIDFESILNLQVSTEIFATLAERKFGRDIQEKISLLLAAFYEHGIVSQKAWMRQGPAEAIVVRKTGSQGEVLLSPPFAYSDTEEARRLVVMQALEQGNDIREMMAISGLVSQLVRPNLVFNGDETEKRREQAYAFVKPVFIKVAANEMLVREGQRIGPEEVLKLKAHQSEGREKHWILVFAAVFAFGFMSLYVITHVARLHLPNFRMEVEDLLFLGILLTGLLLLTRSTVWISGLVGDGSAHFSSKTLLYAVPLSAGAMLACIFFGVTISLIFSVVSVLFAGMVIGKDFGLFFYFMIGAFVAAHGVSPCRNRMIPIKAGMLVGITNVFLVLLSAFLLDQWVFLRILTNAFFGLCGGLFAGVLVTGLTPLAEMIFGYTTDIKLLELATMDQPLLQDLMVEAPGTYHHSIIVGNMVEAAAKSIGANSLLAKVAAYYHDIGKIKKPLYFIENQFDCENRHEKLAPSMSSLILISHVKDGYELARQSRLGREICSIISQHHGRNFISFFYNKAMEAREKAQSSKGAMLPPIDVDNYRYPGPKPQTKEAGLVMLADIVEAATRTLAEPTPARIQGLVHKLINSTFTDGQLDECELTLKDLHQIARHFNQILATIHHKRIEYPAAANGKGKPDAPDPGQRESKQDRDKGAGNRERGKPDLKRLGIH